MTHFQDPKSVVPGSLMPPYPLPGDIFDDLTRYLLSRPLPAVPAAPAEQLHGALRALPRREGPGDGVIADYLDPRPRDLTKVAFMRSKTRERLVESLMEGRRPGTSMAPWGKVLGDARSRGARRLRARRR